MELYAIMSKPCIAYRPMSKGGRVLIEISREVELNVVIGKKVLCVVSRRRIAHSQMHVCVHCGHAES